MIRFDWIKLLDERGDEIEPRVPYDDPHLEKYHNEYHNFFYTTFCFLQKSYHLLSNFTFISRSFKGSRFYLMENAHLVVPSTTNSRGARMMSNGCTVLKIRERQRRKRVLFEFYTIPRRCLEREFIVILLSRSIRQTQPWSKFNIWLLRSAKWSTLPFSCLIARTPYLCYFPLLRKLDSKYKLSKLFRSWWFRFREWCLAKALERCKGETVPIPPFLHCLGEIAERPNGILSQSSRLVDEG